MPTSTFFNLNTEKQIRIIKAAIDEFAVNMYSQSSINQIVNKAEISKGSFYQYFSGKDDLFKYIINKLMAEEFEYSEKIIIELEDSDFFETLQVLFNRLVDFYKEHPKSLAVMIKFMKMNDKEFKEKILEDMINQSQQFFKKLLKEGIRKEEVNPNLDIEFTAYLLTDLIINIIDNYFNKLDCKEDREKIVKLFNKILVILKEGIKKDK